MPKNVAGRCKSRRPQPNRVTKRSPPPSAVAAWEPLLLCDHAPASSLCASLHERELQKRFDRALLTLSLQAPTAAFLALQFDWRNLTVGPATWRPVASVMSTTAQCAAGPAGNSEFCLCGCSIAALSLPVSTAVKTTRCSQLGGACGCTRRHEAPSGGWRGGRGGRHHCAGVRMRERECGQRQDAEAAAGGQQRARRPGDGGGAEAACTRFPHQQLSPVCLLG